MWAAEVFRFCCLPRLLFCLRVIWLLCFPLIVLVLSFTRYNICLLVCYEWFYVCVVVLLIVYCGFGLVLVVVSLFWWRVVVCCLLLLWFKIGICG